MSNQSTEENKTQTDALSLDESNLNTTVKLVSNQNTEFECTLQEIQCSNVLVVAFKDLNSNETQNSNIELSNIDTETLKYIVDYLKHHNGVEPPLPEKPVRSKNMNEITTEWMAEFIDSIVKKDILILYKVISAANYLYTNSLLHICCAKIASMIKGVPIDEIKNTLLQQSKSNDIDVEEKTNE
jgi:S-phase kinase-associated protein 1